MIKAHAPSPDWKFSSPESNRGVLIASDSRVEWMIPWWWNNYRKYNDFPISIVDFGMSEGALKWCQQIGTVYDFDYSSPFIYAKELVPEQVKAFMKKRIFIEDIWAVRKQWFKKPFAMLQTPHQTTLWLDLDCEVLASLEGLFNLHEQKRGISMVEEDQISSESWVKDGLLQPGDVMDNSGVIVYDHSIPLMASWANKILEKNHLYCGNQHCLSELIRNEAYAINSLPKEYNWRIKDGNNPDAKIVHWVSDRGKMYIANQIKKRHSN